MTVHPGLALDCCGNDLVVEHPHVIPEAGLVDRRRPWIRELLQAATDREAVYDDLPPAVRGRLQAAAAARLRWRA